MCPWQRFERRAKTAKSAVEAKRKMLTIFKLISANSTASSSLILSRAFAVKTDLPVKWIRPEKIASTNAVKSGDLSTFKYPEENRFLLWFDKSEELKTADEMVKRMFTLEQHRRKEYTNWDRRETTDLVRRHDYDGGSLEVRSKLELHYATTPLTILSFSRQVDVADPSNAGVLREVPEKQSREGAMQAHDRQAQEVSQTASHVRLPSLRVAYREARHPLSTLP